MIGLDRNTQPVVAQDGVNHSQELVGGGENGAFVAEAAGVRAVIAVELGALGADGAVGAFGQGGPQGRVASARPAGAALAGAGVVAGRDAGSGAEVARVAESAQVGSELDEDGGGTAEVDAGNRLQQPQGR